MVKPPLETRVWTVVQSFSVRFQTLRLDRDPLGGPCGGTRGDKGVVPAQAGTLPEGGALSTRAVLKDASDVKPIPDPTLQPRAADAIPGKPVLAPSPAVDERCRSVVGVVAD